MSLSSLKNRAAAQNGFSLIELLVVVLIIGILAAIMIPRFLGQRDNANNSQAQSSVRNAASAAEAYYQKNGESFGATNAAATEGVAKAIDSSEPNLDVVGGTASPTTPVGATGSAATAGTDAAEPKDVWVIATSGINGTATICATGKGDRAYCMKVAGTGATEYGRSTDADPNVGEAYTQLGAAATNWDG